MGLNLPRSGLVQPAVGADASALRAPAPLNGTLYPEALPIMAIA